MFFVSRIQKHFSFSACSETLLKSTCQHLLLLVGFDTLTYRKDYDRSPILVGHQETDTLQEPMEEEIAETKIALGEKEDESEEQKEELPFNESNSLTLTVYDMQQL